MDVAPAGPQRGDRDRLDLVAGAAGPAALELTGLGADADRLVREYSQGMRRKVAIAAAIIADPPALIFDEALNGLDPPSALRVAEAPQRRVPGGRPRFQ